MSKTWNFSIYINMFHKSFNISIKLKHLKWSRRPGDLQKHRVWKDFQLCFTVDRAGMCTAATHMESELSIGVGEA